MKCPTCASEQIRVASTVDREDRIERRRRCLSCGRRWKTLEVHAAEAELATEVVQAGKHFVFLMGQIGVTGGE